MAAGQTAVTVLRVVTFLTIGLGVLALIGGLASGQMVQVFGVLIPSWIAGAMVTFVGVRYWLRLRAIEEKLTLKS